MLTAEATPLSVKFFQNGHTVCLFGPDPFKVYLYATSRWVESDDMNLREDIRFHSMELSRKVSLQCARG